MQVIGLTGGIGAGKSTVSKILSEAYHLPIIDADQIAREVVLPEKPALKKIAEVFGSEMIMDDGSMNRCKMGVLIRKDPVAKKRLEAITHREIQADVEKKIAVYRSENHPLVIYDCPLLFEAHQEALCDRTVMVTVDQAIRIARLMARDQIDRETALAKIAIQMSEAEKNALADDLIDNSGDLKHLKAEISSVYQKWVRNANCSKT